MADTGIGVSWHLEYACPFRQGKAVGEYGAACKAVWRLRAIDPILATGDVYGDLAVHGTVYYAGTKSPSRGFRISEVVAPVGSVDAARDTCGPCPANALRASTGTPGGDPMAGCCGWLPFDPGDPVHDAALHGALKAAGLGQRFEAAFPATRPIGYGLWIASPLDREQLDVLAAVLPGGKWGRASADVTTFGRACVLAARHDLRLHVSLSPPGHTDFGYLTTFPHCPRCKRGSGERWKKAYSTKPRACAACGHTYVPAETAASEPMGDDEGDNELEGMLPPDEYQALRAEWLRRHADDPQDWLDQLMAGNRAGGGEANRRSSLLGRLWGWLKR